MEYLYDFVCAHVEYVEYERMVDESYFYDAVCKGQSLCDGYSNMLSILFRLIGVECCEAMGQNTDGTGGHTWVVAKLGDEFYNFDPTFEDTGETPANTRIWFGFSDRLIGVEELEYEDLRPKCTDTNRDFLYADLTVSSITEWDEVEKIAALAEERLGNGQDTTLVVVTAPLGDRDPDLFFDRFYTYATRADSISLLGWPMGACTLVEITLTD